MPDVRPCGVASPPTSRNASRHENARGRWRAPSALLRNLPFESLTRFFSAFPLVEPRKVFGSFSTTQLRGRGGVPPPPVSRKQTSAFVCQSP